MNITKEQLKQIIKEELANILESPRMSGAMDPEDPSVMADIERRNNQGLEEEVRELYAQEISNLAMIMYSAGEMSQEDALAALAEDPRVDVEGMLPEEAALVYSLAQEEAEEM